MKKAFLFLAFLAFVTPAFAADDEYVFILSGRSNPYWTAMKHGVEDAAKAARIKTVIYEAENERDAEGELNICLTAIQRKPRAIVMSSINSSVGIQCYKQAVAAKIIVADVDANLPVAEAARAGVTLAFSIGSDNTLIGEDAAKYVGTITDKPDPKIFILEGAAGSLNGKRRVDGFRSRLQKLKPAAKVVASVSAEYDRLKALNTTSDVLQRQPDLDIIYAANDEMALGAAEAVRNAGRRAQIKIIGIDGTADARRAVLDGRLTATVAQLPYFMGKRAVEMIVESVRGGKMSVTETTPTPVLTKSLIEDNKDPVLKYVR